MRGTEVSQSALVAAEDFLNVTERGVNKGAPEFTMKRDTLIRLLAWYGELVRSGAGTGSGHFYVAKPKKPAARGKK